MALQPITQPNHLLRPLIRRAICVSAWNGRSEYLPADRVDALTSRENIESQLIAANIFSTSLVHFVQERAKRTFLMLVHIENVAQLESLKRDGFSDDDLSISRDWNELGEVIVRSIHEPPSSKPGRWPSFSKWSKEQIRRLWYDQWIFMAPIFTKDSFHEFYPARPLPFVSKEYRLSVSGGAQPYVEPHLRPSIKSDYQITCYDVVIHDAHQRVFQQVRKDLILPSLTMS
jgi:hypothetical protein